MTLMFIFCLHSDAKNLRDADICSRCSHKNIFVFIFSMKIEAVVSDIYEK